MPERGGGSLTAGLAHFQTWDESSWGRPRESSGRRLLFSVQGRVEGMGILESWGCGLGGPARVRLRYQPGRMEGKGFLDLDHVSVAVTNSTRRSNQVDVLMS